MNSRVGIGYDIHRLETCRKLVLGGVEIPFDKGLSGHSDADVLIHAIIDALLGAIAEGDIGTHFPPDNDAYKDIDSTLLLEKVTKLLKDKGFLISNIDANIIAEQPKMKPFIQAIRKKLAQIMLLEDKNISVKAKTNEGLGPIGEGKAIAAQVVVMVRAAE